MARSFLKTDKSWIDYSALTQKGLLANFYGLFNANV